MPDEPDVQADHGVGVGAGLEDRVPVAAEQRRQADLVGPLGKRDRTEAALGVAADLGGAHLRVGQERDAHGMMRSGYGCHHSS